MSGTKIKKIHIEQTATWTLCEQRIEPQTKLYPGIPHEFGADACANCKRIHEKKTQKACAT